MQARLPPPPRHFLHTFSDGSVLRKMPARDLISIEVWHGNRILNQEHKKEIFESLKQGVRGLDLKPFHVIRYPLEDEETGEQTFRTCIIDGQHRTSILKDSFTLNPDSLSFDVLVVERSCISEEDAIEYFKILNQTRAIEWKEDPKLLASKFVAPFEKEFNTAKLKLVRAHGCHRPYLSTEKLRDAIVSYKIYEKGKKPAEFVQFARQKNREFAEYFTGLREKDKMMERAIGLDFFLALDDRFKWMEGF